jgi:hypothetical protein
LRGGERLAGYIKLYRDIQEHWLWRDKPFSKGQAWADLLLSANHESNKVVFGNDIIPVERGSLITSEVKLSGRWGWSRHKVRCFLDLLKNDTMIVKKTDTKRTYINIVNYSVWQDSSTAKEQKKDNKGTAEGQLRDTNKNDKNVKNINNNIFVPPSLDEVIAYCQERKNSINPQSFIDHYTASNWFRGKTKITNWKACVRTWEQNDKKKPDKPPPSNATNFKQREYSEEFYDKLKGAKKL